MLNEGTKKTRKRELAFYYPNQMWRDGDQVKNLVLFFDGIALLVPRYMKDRFQQDDPAIVAGLRQHGLLEIIHPETALDKKLTERLAVAFGDLFSSGRLDRLHPTTTFHEISMSRIGYFGDRELAEGLLTELKRRGLARDTEDGVSIPMHPLVRVLVLVLLAQILRPHGLKLNAELSPATDRPELVAALGELLAVRTGPDESAVISVDLNTVGVDLGPVPIDEVLDFREQNYAAHKRYRQSVRRFVGQLSQMQPGERKGSLEERQAELDDLASDLKRVSRAAWKRPASFALALTGAAWTAIRGDPIGAVLAAAGVALGAGSTAGPRLGAYSYLFSARERFSY